MRVSQQAIADKLNVSVATVSRSLRNNRDIHPQTRARVLQAASELGYRLSSSTRAAAKGDPIVNVGVLLYGEPAATGANSVVRTRIVEGIAEEARRQDVALQLDYVPRELRSRIDEPEVQPIGLRRRQWAGTILAGHFGGDAVARFAEKNLCVQVAHYTPGSKVDCIDHDDADSCEALVDHLWQLGHRRIGYAANNIDTPSRSNRLGGICGALSRRGVLMAPEDAVRAIGEGMSGAAVAAAVQARVEDGVTGWVCENDIIGYRLIEDLRALGLDCPADISVCGFDNLPAPAGLPKLTTIDAPFEEMGAMAVSRLMQRMKRDAMDVVHTMLTCRLIVGDSTQRRTS